MVATLHPITTTTIIRQFSRIIVALFAMTGRLTMLGISRWAGTDGSYHAIYRWFHTIIPMAKPQLFEARQVLWHSPIQRLHRLKN